MTLARSISGGKVVCVLSTSDTHPHPIVRALAEAGADLEIVGDVYRGLARWGPKSRSAFAAVVVDVDRLDASEMEFFDLAARYRWNVPTLVFARSAGSPKLQEALLRGARTAVDPESVVQQVWRGLEPAPVSESEPEKAAVEPAPPAHAIDEHLDRRLAAAIGVGEDLLHQYRERPQERLGLVGRLWMFGMPQVLIALAATSYVLYQLGEWLHLGIRYR